MSAERASSAGPARAGPLQAQAAARFAFCSIHDASSSLQLSKLQDTSGHAEVGDQGDAEQFAFRIAAPWLCMVRFTWFL